MLSFIPTGLDLADEFSTSLFFKGLLLSTTDVCLSADGRAGLLTTGLNSGLSDNPGVPLFNLGERSGLDGTKEGLDDEKTRLSLCRGLKYRP